MTSILALHFFCYTLMTLIALFVILLSMPLILLTTIRVTRHLVCDINQNWLLNLHLICETLWRGAESGLLMPMLEKIELFRLAGLITQVLFMLKLMDLFLRKTIFQGARTFSLLIWTGDFTLSLLLKLPSTKLKPRLVRCPEVALHLYKSTIRSCLGYCCHLWAVCPSFYLDILYKLYCQVCMIAGLSPAISPQPQAHLQYVASLTYFLQVLLW